MRLQVRRACRCRRLLAAAFLIYVVCALGEVNSWGFQNGSNANVIASSSDISPKKWYWKSRSRTKLGNVKRRGAGVYFFAYGSDLETFKNFARQVAQAGSLFKKYSPGIPLAVATSFSYPDFDKYFDHQIRIRQDHNFAGSNYQNRSDGFNRQWLTRILYLTATPFEVTLAYDANVVSCGPLETTLRTLSRSDFDLAVASVGFRSNLPVDAQPHNFALAYRWNENTAGFLDEWFMTQVSSGVAHDDQHTLLRAVNAYQPRHLDFKFRVLNPSVAAAFVSTKASAGFFPRETRVISGKALVIHENPFQAAKICGVLNQFEVRRQVVSDGKTWYTVYDPHECALKINRSSCKYHALWNLSGEAQLVPPI